MIALPVLFFFSGVSALVYQVLWLRLLGLVFGVTVHAATTVLASFMAGLAVGSLLAGRFAERARVPLRWFGAAEILIGLSALGTSVAFDELTGLYTIVHSAFTPGLPVTTVLRFAGASLVLIVPTSLMGASLPLVMRSALAADARVAGQFALLYAMNTAGAIAGTLVVGFVLIERVGIASSFRLAALVNVLVGAAAIAMSRFAPVEPTESPRRETPSATPLTPFERRVVLVFALSGFAALALEIVWFRLLVLFVPATTYAFSTMLAAVLFGIAAGSALAVPLLRRPGDHRRRLALVEVGVGLAAMLSMTALTLTYRAGWRTSATIQASLLAIAPATILMGLAFPLGVRLIAGPDQERAEDAPRRVGLLYGVNVGAAIAGAVMAGFALVPRLGTRQSMIAAAALHTLAGLILFDRRRPAHVALGSAAILAFALVALGVPDPFDAVLSRRYGGERLLWREEAAQSTVTVTEGEANRTLYLDGLHQSNDSPAMVHVHRQIGHLPMAVHPRPREALVIGLGAGATAGAVARHEGVQVDLVELSQPVVRASALFDHINGSVVQRPNVRLLVDDARNHLLLTAKRYDVITADIIQPIHAGAGNVYSREYFTLVRHAVRENGLVLQWIGNRPAAEYLLILRTFLSVFPEATLWADGTLLLAGVGPVRIDLPAFERKLADESTRAALAQVGITSAETLLALYTAGPEELRRFAGRGPLLTDDRPMLEFFGSLPRGEQIDLSGLRGDVRRQLAP